MLESTTRPHERTSRLPAIIALGLLLIWALVLTLPHYYNLPLRLDLTASSGNVGIFAEEARTVANGVLYRDLWSNKPPGMFIIMGLFVKAMGSTAAAIAASTLFMNAFFVVAVTALAYVISGSWPATLIGGAFALMVSANFRLPETTVPMAALCATAMILALAGRGRWPYLLAAGAVFTCAALTKQPVMAELPVLLAFAAVRTPGNLRRKLPAAVIVAVGVALAVGVFALWAIWNGSAQSMWFHVYSSVGQYVFRSDGDWHFSQEGLDIFRDDFLGDTLPYMITLFVLGTVSAVVLLVKRRRDPLVWIVIGWALLAFLAASVPRGLSLVYYRQTVPSLIALIALAVVTVQQMQPSRQVALGALLTVGAIWFGYKWVGWTPLASDYNNGMADDQPVVDLIEQRTQPGDCLWMWGNIIHFSYLTERPSCVGASYEGYMMDTSAFPVVPFRSEYLHDLFNHPSTLHILDSAWGFFPELQKFADRYLGPLVLTSGKYAVFSMDMAKFHRVDANFGGEIRLFGYDLPPKDGYCPGDSLPMALTWERESTPTHQYQAFVQVLTSDETARVAGFDSLPANRRPTNTWVDLNELVLGPNFDVTIPAETKPGTYKLIAGLYNVDGGERLNTLGADGQPNGTYAHLRDVIVKSDCPAVSS